MNKPQNQGWRSGTAPKGRRQKSRDWRQDKPSHGPSRIRWGRILKVGTGLGTIGVLVALLIMLWSWFSGKQTTQILAIGPTSYNALEPGLDGPAADELGRLWATPDGADVQEYVALPDGGFEVPANIGTTAIICLNAVARPDKDGRGIVLLDGSAQPDTWESGGATLGDLAQKLRKARGNKLVLIDVSRVRTHWRLGLIVSDFIRDVREVAGKTPDTVFLTSSDVGERSWSAPQFGGRSAFLHFAREGLHGAADADADGYVTSRELVQHVQSATSDWVYRNREVAPGQHPQCFPPLDKIPAERDFTVARVQSKPKSLLTELTSTSAEQSQIVEQWGELQKLGEIWRDAPIGWRLVVRDLQRAEEYLSLGRSSQATGAVASARGHLERLGQRSGIESAFRKVDFFTRDVVARRNADAATDSDSASITALPETVISQTLAWFNRQRESQGQQVIDPAMVLDAVAAQKLSQTAVAESLGLVPFLSEGLHQADVTRRAAFDQIFTSQAGDTDFEPLTSAQNHVRSQARIVRDAEQALFDSLNVLPYLADMVADDMRQSDRRESLMSFARAAVNRDLFFSAGDDETSGFLQAAPAAICQRTRVLDSTFGSDNIPAQVAALFAETRALRHQFAGVWNVDGMDVLGRQVRQRLETLTKEVEDRAREIKNAMNEQPTALDWGRLVRVLRIPLLPADLRSDLLEERLRYERNVNPRTPPGTTDADVSPRVAMLQRGEWQAFWMLQLLTLSEDASIGTGNAPLPVVRGKLQHRDNVDRWVAVDENDKTDTSYKRLVELGYFGHQHFGRLLEQVEEDLDRGSATSDLLERRRFYARADYLARVLNPFDAAELQAKRTPPVQRMHEVQAAEFALYYGDRTWHDFWRIPDTPPGEDDWYRAVIAKCLTLSENNNALSSPQHAELNGRMQDTQLKLAAPTDVVFSRADQSKPLEVAIRESNVPAGRAAIWLRPAGKLSVRIAANGLPLETSAGATRRFDLQRDVGGSECHEGELSADLFFRGHLRAVSTPVNPCSEPSSIVKRLPPPPTGTIEVQGQAERSIVFVLDWSLSMSEFFNSDTKKLEQTNRWKTAVEKLNAVIGQLDEKDEVGLVLFGHRVVYKGAEIGYQVNPNWELYGPRKPSADSNGLFSDFQTLAGLQKKQAAMLPSGKPTPVTLADWLKKLREDPLYGPFGNTPMYGAIHSAWELLKRDGGAIVVITDGAADDKPGQIKTRLQRSNVAATVILFDFNDPANQQIILANGMSTLRAANDPANLAKAINDAIPARDYSANWGANFSKSALLGEPLTGLSPSVYRIQSGLNTKLEGVRIRGGEHHRLRITNSRFKRVRTHQVLGPHKVAGGADNGNPTLLGHTAFRINQQQAEIVVILDHEDSDSPVNWPAEIGFELAPVGGEPVRNFDIEFVPNQPVPTWRLKTSDWPATHPDALVSAFWKMEATPVDKTVAWTTLANGDQLELPGIPGRLPDMTVEGVWRAPELTVTVRAQGPIPAGESPLKDLRLQLGRSAGDTFAADALPVRISRWPEGGIAEFSFTLPESLPRNLQIGITSGKSLKNGAIRIDGTGFERRPTAVP